MKKYLVSALLLTGFFALAQNDETKRLKVTIVNEKGKIVNSSNIFFATNSEQAAIPMGKKGITFIETMLPCDTLTVITTSNAYRIPVSGLDSVVLRLGSKKQYVVKGEGNYTYDLGYYTVSKSDNTMPINKLNMRDKGSYTDLASYLEGRVAGVQVVSGENAEKRVIIRGINTFNGDVGALVVVDGMMYESFDVANRSVNIRDIKSVDILMDGSIYGVRGSNGVVLITTQTSIK